MVQPVTPGLETQNPVWAGRWAVSEVLLVKVSSSSPRGGEAHPEATTFPEAVPHGEASSMGSYYTLTGAEEEAGVSGPSPAESRWGPPALTS